MQCKVDQRYINKASQLSVPDGMMATQKMTINAYASLMHDPLMADPVEPTSSRAWFIKDGIRLLYTVALFMADMRMLRISSSLPWRGNGPFPSFPGPLFQNEGRCSAFGMEIIFHSHANKTHFHKKDCAPSVILKVRVFGTRKWPIFTLVRVILWLEMKNLS